MMVASDVPVDRPIDFVLTRRALIGLIAYYVILLISGTGNEAAMGEVEAWSKGAVAQLDTQLRERRRNFRKRLEAVERIQLAAGTLDERLTELTAQERSLEQVHRQLLELTSLLAHHGVPDVKATTDTLPGSTSDAA